MTYIRTRVAVVAASLCIFSSAGIVASVDQTHPDRVARSSWSGPVVASATQPDRSSWS